MFEYEDIKEIARSAGVRVTDLIALSSGNDPFYAGVPARRESAEWFAEIWQKFGHQGAHIRRIHYALVSQSEPIRLPNGDRYENTENDWKTLVKGSLAARYLNLIPDGVLVDRRNPQPMIKADSMPQKMSPSIYCAGASIEFELPEEFPVPELMLSGFDRGQPHLVEVWAEKSTMNDVLIPLSDTYLKSRDELVGILNGGHKRGAKVYRCEGDSNKVRGFKAFSAVATAGIGKLPATLGDRSIPLRMRRAGKDENIIPLRQDRAHHEIELKRKAIRWATDHFDKLSGSDPETPAWMFNRAADNWRPLFAVADAVGGVWPERARNIAAVLSNETVSEESYRLMALRDLDNLFRERDAEYLLSEEVVEAFKQIEERPWADWKGKNGFTTNQLARLLEEFDIRPKAIKTANSRRGYQIKDCKAVFAAYLPPQTATPLQPNETADHSDIQTATKADEVAVVNPRKPAETLEGSGVAVCKGAGGHEGNTSGESDDPDTFVIPAFLDRRPPLICVRCKAPVNREERGLTWLRDNGAVVHKGACISIT